MENTGFPRAGADSIEDKFEDLNNWDILNSNIRLSTNRTNGSSKSIKVYIPDDEPSNPVARMDIQKVGNSRPVKVSFDWCDPSGLGSGGGILFTDVRGNIVFGHGSDNPQWDRVDGDGWHFTEQGGSYGEWVHVEFTPDWVNGSYDYEITSDQGRSVSGTGSLGGNSIAAVNIAQWHKSNVRGKQIPDGPSQSPNSGYYVAMYFDNIVLEY